MAAFSQGVFSAFKFLFVFLVIPDVKTQEISIQSIKPIHRVSEAFVSFNIDPNTLLSNEFNSENMSKMLAMARALSPAYVRLAGPTTSMYQFIDNTTYKNNTLITESQIETVGKFARVANLHLVLAMNAALRTKDGDWDTTQAKQLLTLADKLDLDIAVQMGYDRLRSEPSVRGASLAKDIEVMVQLVHNFPRYSETLILGPDVSNLDSEKDVTRCLELLNRASSILSAITWHPTPFVLRPSKDAEKVADRATGAIATLEIASRQFNNIMRMTPAARKDIWLGGAKSTSGRYVDAMMVVSRLGQAARLGISVVMQTLKYDALVKPSPEFWASVLYRQLVGRDVLDTQLHDGDRRRVHVFAHCSKQSGSSGGVTVFAVNYSPHDVSSNVKARWTAQTKNGVRRYVLTSTDDPLSRTILLNGKTLNLLPNGDVPLLEPELLPFNHGNQISIFIPKFSISFWEFPTAYAKACMRNNDYKASYLPIKKRTSNVTKREIQEFDTNEKDTHFEDAVIVAENGNFREENYIQPGDTMEALLVSPNQAFEPIQFETMSIGNVTSDETKGTQEKTEVLSDDLKSELSPAAMYFGFEEVNPGVHMSNDEDLEEVQDELYAAEYKASMNENNITSTNLTISSDVEEDENTMFVISGLLHKINESESKEINVEEKIDVSYDSQLLARSTNNETTDFLKINSTDIKYVDESINNVPVPNLFLHDALVTNNSELSYTETQATKNNISTPTPDFTLKTTEESYSNNLFVPLPQKYTKSLDEVATFDNAANQRESIRVSSEEDNFSVKINDMEITTHEMPKRDLQSYRNFLHDRNYLKIKETPVPSTKTLNINTEILDETEKETTEAFKTEETSETTIMTSVTEQENKTENIDSKQKRNSFKSRHVLTGRPTLEDSIRKRLERVQELRERIACLKKGGTCKSVIKRQADDDWDFDDPEEPVIDVPLNKTETKMEGTTLNDFLNSPQVGPRMNFPRAPKLKLPLVTFPPLVRSTLRPQTFPNLTIPPLPTIPPLRRISRPTLPPVEISTVPPVTSPSFPAFNPDNIFSLPSLPFTLPPQRPSEGSSSEELVENTNADAAGTSQNVPSVPLIPLTRITTPVPNTSSTVSWLDKIRAKLAERFPNLKRQRRQIMNNKFKNLETLNIPTYIQANIPLLRLPPLAKLKPTHGKLFEKPMKGEKSENRATSNKMQTKGQSNSDVVFDENGQAYKKVKALNSMSEKEKNTNDHGWPDEYNLERLSGASPVDAFESDWPFPNGREENNKKLTRNPTCSCQPNCYARRTKRNINDSTVEKFRNSLLYRFKKWELEDKINQIDNSINDDVWTGNKIVISTIPLSQKQENVDTELTTETPPTSESTVKPKVKVNHIKEAIHKLILVPVVRGANRVFCSFRNFLNGARGC